MLFPSAKHVRMAEWSKALRSGRSLLLQQAWVEIPLLTHFCAAPLSHRQSVHMHLCITIQLKCYYIHVYCSLQLGIQYITEAKNIRRHNVKNYFWSEGNVTVIQGKNIGLSYPCVRLDKSDFFEISHLVVSGSLLPIQSWMII